MFTLNYTIRNENVSFRSYDNINLRVKDSIDEQVRIFYKKNLTEYEGIAKELPTKEFLFKIY